MLKGEGRMPKVLHYYGMDKGEIARWMGKVAKLLREMGEIVAFCN